MSNKIPSRISVNVEKVGQEWIVEIYWPNAESVWIAKDRNRIRAIQKAEEKLTLPTEALYVMEFPELKRENFRNWSKRIKKR